MLLETSLEMEGKNIPPPYPQKTYKKRYKFQLNSQFHSLSTGRIIPLPTLVSRIPLVPDFLELSALRREGLISDILAKKKRPGSHRWFVQGHQRKAGARVESSRITARSAGFPSIEKGENLQNNKEKVSVFHYKMKCSYYQQ